MGMGDTKSLDSAVELRDEGEQFDAATYVASAIFNSAAYPPGMPEYLIRHIEAEASFAQRLDDAGMTIGGASGGPIGEKSKAERQKDADDDAFEFLSAAIETAEREKHEREEWEHTRSTVGGVTMTGAEWAEFAERLRTDNKLHDELIEEFIRRGMTREDAERRYDRLQKVAEIAAIPPSQRSDDQKKVIADTNADPSFKRDMGDAQSAISKDRPGASSALNTTFSAASSGASPVSAAVAPAAAAPKVAVIETSGPGF